MNNFGPVIGVTARREILRDRVADAVEAEYSQAIVQAGGLPFLIPSGPLKSALSYLNLVDGLMLTGGGDIDPVRYGDIPSPRAGGIDPERDEVEILVVRAALSRGIPVLGICRGCQLMNVAFGGTLFQHLPEVTDLPHFVPVTREHGAHLVRLQTGSRLAAVVGGGELLVNSVHHQAVKDLAPQLRAVAWAFDGTVEAIEMEDSPGLGVQWHPENLQHAPRQRALFDWLIAAAQNRQMAESGTSQ